MINLKYSLQHSVSIFVFLMIPILLATVADTSDFLKEQKQHKKVKTAFAEKEIIVKDNLRKHGVKLEELNVIFVVYKDEEVFEIYGKNKSDKAYKKVSFEL